MRILSIIVGAIFVAWIANGLHSNPRWTWSPGEGELPRDVVAMYMDTAYKQGKLDEAAELFLTPKTQDEVPADHILPEGKPFEPQVKRVIAEGFNVAVHYTVQSEAGEPAEYIEIFNVRGGRITSRERIVRQQSAEATQLSGSAPQLAAAAPATGE